MKWRLLCSGVYTSGRFSIERTPRGGWMLYQHVGDAAEACSSGDTSTAPERLGAFDLINEARDHASKLGDVGEVRT